MCFDRNINGNRDVKFLECDYLLVQRSVKLTLTMQNIDLLIRTETILSNEINMLMYHFDVSKS